MPAVERILAAIDAAPVTPPQRLRDRAIVEMLYGGGLRVSELVSLDVGAVNRDSASAIILGKGARERVVLFGRPAMAALDAYLAEGRPAMIKACALAGRRPRAFPARRTYRRADALFLNRFGGRLDGRSVQTLIKGYGAAVGLRDVHPHLFRHSFATHLMDGGADVRIIQDLLGHTSANSTQIYTHVSQARQAEVSAKAWERVFEGRPARQAIAHAEHSEAS